MKQPKVPEPKTGGLGQLDRPPFQQKDRRMRFAHTPFQELDWIMVFKDAISSCPSSFYPVGFQPMPGFFKTFADARYSPADWKRSSEELRLAALRQSGVRRFKDVKKG